MLIKDERKHQWMAIYKKNLKNQYLLLNIEKKVATFETETIGTSTQNETTE